MRRLVIVSSVLAFSFACGDTAAGLDPDAGSGGGGGTVAPNDLPCDVAQLLAARCLSCHGEPLAGGAPQPLRSRADLAAASPLFPGKTLAERSLARLQESAAPMPPSPAPMATPGEVAAFQAWVQAGLPVGECGTLDAGVPDAGPAPTTCASNSYWSFGDNGSSHMKPGEACVSCHQVREPFRAYYFMGTVFGGFHEQNDCNAAPPAGLVVDIIDANGLVALTIPVRSPSGNFYSTSRAAGVALPYTARVRDAQGHLRVMVGPQMNGDCNSCHTEQGAQNAPGRIAWPF